MKKFFALAALVSVALTGCVTNEQFEDAEPAEIVMQAVNKVPTRDIVSGTTFSGDFKVFGFFSEDDFANTEEFGMYDVVCTEVDGVYKNSTTSYYWPMSGKVGFYAVAPASIVPTTVSWADGLTLTNYNVNDAKVTDVMFAYNWGQKGSSALEMVFSHALSQVGATVATDKNYPGATLTITSIAFKNVDVEATFTQKATPQWTNNTDAQTATMPLIAPATAPTLSTSRVNYGDTNVVAIPQALATGTGTNAKLSIAYTLTQNGKNISGVVEPTIIATTNTEANTWESGKKYIYNITFFLEEITFNPSATDWVNVTTDAISIEG